MASIGTFLKARWGALSAILIILAIQIIAAFIIKTQIAGMISFLLTLLLLYLYARWRGTGAREYGLQRPESWTRTLLLGVIYFIVAFLLLRLTLEPLVERIYGPRDFSTFAYLKGNTAALLRYLVMIWILAAFFEELLYRGFLLNSIADIFRRHPAAWIVAIAISTSIFALGHAYQSISGVIFTGAAAIYVSIIYLAHGRNLWIPIIVHGLHNSSSGFFLYYDIYPRVIHLLF